MYTLSVWAVQHKWPARIAIVVSYILLYFLGLFIGDGLQLFQITIPLFCFYTAVVVFLAVFLVYPEKGHKPPFSHFYRYRKSCDLVLVATSFFFVVCVGNQPQRVWRLSTPFASAASVSPMNKGLERPAFEKGKPAKKWSHKMSKKALRQTLKEKVQVLWKTYKETSKGGKIALVVLSVLVAIALWMLVGALSCNIACTGSGGLALLVAILGTALITFLLVRVIRRITKGPREVKPAKTPPAAT